MIVYFVKATLCALLFLIAYMLLLEKENMHRFKRVYLLCSLTLSMTIPLVIVQFAQPLVVKDPGNIQIENKSDLSEYVPVIIENVTNRVKVTNHSDAAIDYLLWFKIIYLSISVIFLLKFGRNLASFYSSVQKGQPVLHSDLKIILCKKKVPPYSFGNCIFINKDDYENGRIANEILCHEQAHVSQKHSLDIIFIELMIVACWFNPVLYLYRLKIKQNHEFLADETVLKTNKDIPGYQNILISIISNNGSIGLASAINYSIIKKRFIMMTKKTSKKKAWWSKAMLVPAFAVAVFLFSTQSVANNPSKGVGETSANSKLSKDSLIVPGKGVSNELLKEYQRIVKNKYLLVTKPNGDISWKTMILDKADLDRMYPIFVSMDTTQRNTQLIGFVGPFTFFQLRSPNKDEWSSSKRANILWFNGKRANLSVLKKYTRKNIYTFSNCFVDSEKKIYQAVLWTKDGYKTYMKQHKQGVALSELLAIRPQTWIITSTTKKTTTAKLMFPQ